jgi:polysaccharide chain length determinant protein (PEP-CTERM system associated)
MNPAQEFDFSHILDPIFRRKELAIAIFLVVAILAAYLAAALPDVYRSGTLILVTPQKLPANYVSSTVTLNLEQRMRAIAQQILSRTSLEKIVRELNLFPTGGAEAHLEARVGRLQKKIKLEVNKDESFKLSFDAPTPNEAMQVTTRLASLFVEENLRVREQQASGTTAFINTEARRLRTELEQQENELNLYKLRHQSELPEQLEANLRTLEQLRRELESGMFRLTSIEERKAVLEKQFAETGRLPAVSSGGIEERKRELASLLRRYSEKHPDVVRLKGEIKDLELNDLPQALAAKEGRPIKSNGPRTQIQPIVGSQSEVLASEIELLREKSKRLQYEIDGYQARVSNTPLRSIELSKITRNYDITLKKFQELLSKSFDSQLSENMEKSQRGEQFQVVDRPVSPANPVAPNRPIILLVGLLLGLAGGFGIPFVLDRVDPSFKNNDDLAGFSELPVLAVLPSASTRETIRSERKVRAILVLASLGTVVLGGFLIRFLAPLLTLG